VIIIAAGEALRWNNYLGVPKHFIAIDGEPILARAVRLLRAYGPEIVVVGREERYKLDGAALYFPVLDPENHDADKFLSSRQLWNAFGRTVVLYGDAYYTEEAIATIMTYTGRDWTLFARFGASRFTGCPYGECFAQSFWPEQIPEHLAALLRVRDLQRRKLLDRCGGWEHYMAMNHVSDADIRHVKFLDRAVMVDDWTDDFDKPEDYDRFVARWSARTTADGASEPAYTPVLQDDVPVEPPHDGQQPAGDRVGA
jgi:hypothetical protein